MKENKGLNTVENNIVLAGLVYDTNLGDRAILESTENIVRSILKSEGKKVELRYLDLYGRTKANQSGLEKFLAKGKRGIKSLD